MANQYLMPFEYAKTLTFQTVLASPRIQFYVHDYGRLAKELPEVPYEGDPVIQSHRFFDQLLLGSSL